MKRLLRHYVIVTFSLWGVSKLANGMVFQKGLDTLFVAGLGFMAASILAKPVINILLLPLNLVTFGFFRWVSSAIVLYLVTLLVSEFKLTAFRFAGLQSKWIDIPSMNFTGILAFVAFAFMISLITSFVFWLVR